LKDRLRAIFGSLRSRLIGIYLLVTLCSLLAVSSLVANLMEEFLLSQRTGAQLQEVSRISLDVANDIEAGDADELFKGILNEAYSLGGRILLLDKDSVVQADTASKLNGRLLPYAEVLNVTSGGRESSYGCHHISRTGQSALFDADEKAFWAIYYTSAVIVDGENYGALLMSFSIQDVVDGINEVSSNITAVFVAMAAAITAIIFFLSGWITRPILELTAAIRQMGTQGYVRVDVKDRSSEIGELGTAFNRMSERIEEHDRARDEFVSNASHELKTPLATMKLLSESVIYQDDPDPKLMKEFFGDINHEVDRLSRIVTELLRLVQDDTGASGMHFESVRLDELASTVCERLRPLAEGKNIKLKTTLSPVTLEADALRLEQVAVNLVENAIKYTDEGSVTVSVVAEGEEALFSVTDTGIGIPEDSVPHLFERFYRVDKARSRGTGGTGLGLSITEKIVALHGGHIDVHSELDRGSSFSVLLPLKREKEARQ